MGAKLRVAGLALGGLTLLLLILSFLAVGLGRFDSSSSQPAIVDLAQTITMPPGTIGEGLAARPVSLDEALALIRAGSIERLILQPDSYADGTRRLYTFGDGVGNNRWDVEGVNVLLTDAHEKNPVPISASAGTTGLDEAQLQSVLSTVRAANAQGRNIMVVDDRDWWARGLPIPRDDYEKVIIP